MKKTVSFLVIFSLAIILSGCSNLQPLIDQGNVAMEEEDYPKAIECFQGYIDQSRSDNKQVKELLAKATVLKESTEAFNDAINLIENKKYEEAIHKLMSVNSSYPQYEEAQEKLSESQIMLAKECIEESKNFYKNKEYDSAYISLSRSLSLDNTNEEAKKLAPIYKKASDDLARIRAKEQEAKALAEAKDQMKIYKQGSGSVGIAVAQVKTTTSFNTGFTTYTRNGDSVFVWVDVWAENFGSRNEHVNPNDFTLSTPDGYTVNPNTETTYSMSNYFDATDLGANQYSGGWLIFYVPQSKEYTLNFSSFSSSVKKDIIP